MPTNDTKLREKVLSKYNLMKDMEIPIGKVRPFTYMPLTDIFSEIEQEARADEKERLSRDNGYVGKYIRVQEAKAKRQGILEERERIRTLLESVLSEIQVEMELDQKEINKWQEREDKENPFYKEMIKAHGGSYTAFKISEKKITTLLSQLEKVQEQPEPLSKKDVHEKELKIGDKIDLSKRESCICNKDCYCNCIYCKCILKRGKTKGGITMSLDQCCLGKDKVEE